MIDLRKHSRFQCNKNILAEVRPYSSIVGKITDICLGGIGFHYIDRGNRISDRFELNLWIDNELYIENIPVKNVSDVEITHMAGSTIKPLKRCGVKFYELTPEQSSKLNSFIRQGTENDKEVS